MPVRVFYQDLTPAGVWRTRDALRAVQRGWGDLRPLRELAAEMERAREARVLAPHRAAGYRGALREEYPAAESERLAGLAAVTDLPADVGAGAAEERVLVLHLLPDGARARRGIAHTVRRNRKRDRAAIGLLLIAAGSEELAAWVRCGRPWFWEA